jgi:anti-anti-sigma factor
MKLSLRSIEGEVLSLQCEGWITQAHMKPGTDAFVAVCGSRTYCQRVLLDLDKTEFVDSSGIGWLMACQKRFTRDHGVLVIHSVPPTIRNVFDLLRLNTVLHLAPDEASARKLALEVHP